MYITRQELKIEIRYLHGQIREIISYFNGAIRNIREDIEELNARIDNLETIITNSKDFGK